MQTRRLLFCIIWLLSAGIEADGQLKNLDSMLNVLKTAKPDTNTVILYLAISDAYQYSNTTLSKEYIRKAGALSQQLDYKQGIFKYYLYTGSVFMVEGNLDSMLYYQEKALDYSRKINDSLSIGISLFNLGIVYRDMSEYEKAIAYCLEGREIMERKGNKSIEVQMNDALQILYNSRGEYSRAIEFGEKAVKQNKELGYHSFLAQAQINLGMNYEKLGKYDKAEALIREALSYGRKSGETRVEAVALQDMAAMAVHRQQYTLVESYLLQSLALYRKIGSLDGEASVLKGLAVCYLQQKKFALARQYADSSLSISSVNGYKIEQVSAWRILSSIYYGMHDVNNGYKYDALSIDSMEAMMREVMSARSARLEKIYEVKANESQIRELEAEKKLQQAALQKRNALNYILAASALALIIISVLSFRNYKQKQKLQQQRINELETQQQLTATEAVLKGEEQERSRLAKDLHDGLGSMLSGIKYSLNTMKGNLIMTPDNAQAFERSMDMLDSSIKEMRRVAHNMMPEALVKFGLDTALRDFCNDINQSGALKVTFQSIGMEGQAIDQTMAITIYRIVQELLNNTIKHAAARQAIIQISKNGNQLTVTAEDDGKGFDTAVLSASKGIGWSSIRNRVDFLKGRMDVQSAPDKGTSVLIEIPAG